MSFIVKPAKITKQLIREIQPFHSFVESGSDMGCDQINEFVDNIICLFKDTSLKQGSKLSSKRSLKRQKQVVDKITGEKIGTWYSNCIAESICDRGIDAGLDPELIKYVYRKYLKPNPNNPQTYKKFIQSLVGCPCSLHTEIRDTFQGNI